MANFILHSLFVVLVAYGVTAYEVGDPCNVGDPEDNTGLYYAHPRDCGKYLQCLHGSFIERSCVSGLHWNAEDGACDWANLANCQQTADIVPRDEVGAACDVGDHEDNTGLYRPHPTDCGQYLQCLHGAFIARDCPSGLHWNEEVVSCDWPSQADCVRNFINILDEEETEAPEDPEPTEAPEIPENPDAPYPGGPCDVGDHEDNDGLYKPHPYDCSKYLKCNHGRFIEMSCAPNLHWNVYKVACDWPQKAGCELQIQQFMGVTSGVGYVPGLVGQAYPIPPAQHA